MTIDDDGSEAQDPGFRHIGEIIAAQKAKIEQALAACDESVAAEAHEDLIRAEHEQRVIETVRRCAAKVARLQNSGNHQTAVEKGQAQ